jgi:hypothetical protein
VDADLIRVLIAEIRAVQAKVGDKIIGARTGVKTPDQEEVRSAIPMLTVSEHGPAGMWRPGFSCRLGKNGRNRPLCRLRRGNNANIEDGYAG